MCALFCKSEKIPTAICYIMLCSVHHWIVFPRPPSWSLFPPSTTPWFTSMLHWCSVVQLLLEQFGIPGSRGSRGSLLADCVVGMQPAESCSCVWRESCPNLAVLSASASTGFSVLVLKNNCDFTVLRVEISCWSFQN